MGIVLGIVLGLAIVIAFVFLGSGETIDDASINDGGGTSTKRAAPAPEP